MVSIANGEANSQQPMPALSEQLARRLLPSAEGETPSTDALALVAADAYIRLRARLAVFLGEQGFDALWRRAIRLSQQGPQEAGDTARADASPTLPPGLHSALRGSNAADAHTRLVAAFASFIGLLFTFIGEELGMRLIAQAWPELMSSAADPQVEGAPL